MMRDICFLDIYVSISAIVYLRGNLIYFQRRGFYFVERGDESVSFLLLETSYLSQSIQCIVERLFQEIKPHRKLSPRELLYKHRTFYDTM